MALINPIKSANNPGALVSSLEAVFGVHEGQVSGDLVHYVDEAHSFGVYYRISSAAADSLKLFIGSSPISTNLSVFGNENFIISKNRNALYFHFVRSSSGEQTETVIAAKSNSGKWNVFYKNNAQTTKLYYDTPGTNFIEHEPCLTASAANSPYIISPYPDINGVVMSELFRVDYLSAFDRNNPPVLAAGNNLYAVPPYPMIDSDTAAFAIQIDSKDYE